MTLDTRIVIGKPTPVRPLFDFCRELLGAPADTPVHEGVCDGNRLGQKEIRNPGGIGLPAWLWIYYGADGPMRHVCDKWCDRKVGPAEWDDEGEHVVTAEDVASHAADIAGDPTENGWSAIEVSFDTAYGYTGPNGESCSDLHARLVRAVGAWCDRKGLPWKWQNEFTGEWHHGTDGLAEFGDAFRSTGAESWFREKALPAILSEVSR